MTRRACQWCDGSGVDPVGMPGEPCPDCQVKMRKYTPESPNEACELCDSAPPAYAYNVEGIGDCVVCEHCASRARP